MKNLGQLMKQAQAMQTKMAEMQAQLEAVEMTGMAGGGMVQLTLNGKGDVKRVKIDKAVVGEPLRRDDWGRQVICYEQGDYSGPHNDHHPEDADLVRRARTRAFAAVDADPGLDRHPELLDLLRQSFSGEAIEWLFSDDFSWPFAFSNLCAALDINAELLRMTAVRTASLDSASRLPSTPSHRTSCRQSLTALPPRSAR